MDDQKCQVIYAEFEGLLKENKFEWVIAQLEEQIRLGKTVSQKIEAVKIDPQELGLAFDTEEPSGKGRKNASKDTFLKRVGYSPRERLQLIIGATEHAVVDVGEISAHLAEFLRQGELTVREITLVSEEENVLARSFPLKESSSRTDAVAKLRSLLSALKLEVSKDAR